MGIENYVSTGITIEFGTSGFVAELLDVTPPGRSRESINVSHMGTVTNHQFVPASLTDNGELQFACHFDPDSAPPISSAAETITITFPSGATWSFSGFMTAYNPSAPLEDKMTADVTVKVTGAIAHVASPTAT